MDLLPKTLSIRYLEVLLDLSYFRLVDILCNRVVRGQIKLVLVTFELLLLLRSLSVLIDLQPLALLVLQQRLALRQLVLLVAFDLLL